MSRIGLALLLACLSVCTGCIGYRRHDRRFDLWTDWNTNGGLRMTAERRKRGSYLNRQIEHFRRIHGVDPVPISARPVIIEPLPQAPPAPGNVPDPLIPPGM